MKWTTEKPAVPGHYWYRGTEFGMNNDSIIVEVYEAVSGLWVYADGLGHLRIADATGQWAGPILKPEEA